MEISLICDCEDCHSALIQVGCVNILCDIPYKLLNDFSESVNESINCNFNNSCDLYEKLNCSQIHIILITHSKGFQGLNLLNDFYDLSSTHIVCTRPVYVLSTIHYSTVNGGRGSGIPRGKGNVARSSWHGFGTGRLIANLKERRYKNECSLLDFLNNDLLHPVSYNELVRINLTTSSNYTNQGPIVKELGIDLLNDFNVQISITAMSNGYCLGSCNYLIKHENIRERIIYISKSSTLRRYTRQFDYSIFDSINRSDIIIVTKHGVESNTVGSSNISDNNVISKRNIGSVKYNNNSKIEVKKEYKTQIKDELFSHDAPLDNTKVEYEKHKDARDPENGLDKLENLIEDCINNVVSGKNVIIPLDFNYEYLIDLFESLNRTIRRRKKQIYLYCVGDGVEDLFDYLDKCCDWVSTERSELTLHSEDPKSPFPDLEEMKTNNQFFYSDTLNGLNNVYREPSILVMAVRDAKDFMGYLDNKNNTFLILQSKYSQPIIRDNNSDTTTNPSTSINTVNATTCNTNGKGAMDRCVCHTINLQTSMSNINVNSRLVLLSSRNRHLKINLDEINVGYIRGRAKPEMLKNLQFSDLDISGQSVRSCLDSKGSVSTGLSKNSNGSVGCGGIQFNKFQVDCTNIHNVVLTPLHNDNGDHRSMSDASSQGPSAGSSSNKKSKKNKSNSSNESQESESATPEASNDVNEAFSFGRYDYSRLLDELHNHFGDKIEVTQADGDKSTVTLSNELFKIDVGTADNTTVIETTDEKYRKCILKSLQDILISI